MISWLAITGAQPLPACSRVCLLLTKIPWLVGSYNRFNSTTVKFFCYDRDGGNLGSCNRPPTGPEIQRFSDSLAACMKVSTHDGTAARAACLPALPASTSDAALPPPHCVPAASCGLGERIDTHIGGHSICKWCGSAGAQVATARGLDISVNMHIDDATKGGLGGWRNTLNFDPLEQYSGIR
jgi:hypothetical protein